MFVPSVTKGANARGTSSLTSTPVPPSSRSGGHVTGNTPEGGGMGIDSTVKDIERDNHENESEAQNDVHVKEEDVGKYTVEENEEAAPKAGEALEKNEKEEPDGDTKTSPSADSGAEEIKQVVKPAHRTEELESVAENARNHEESSHFPEEGPFTTSENMHDASENICSDKAEGVSAQPTAGDEADVSEGISSASTSTEKPVRARLRVHYAGQTKAFPALSVSGEGCSALGSPPPCERGLSNSGHESKFLSEKEEIEKTDDGNGSGAEEESKSCIEKEISKKTQTHEKEPDHHICADIKNANRSIESKVIDSNDFGTGCMSRVKSMPGIDEHETSESVREMFFRMIAQKGCVLPKCSTCRNFWTEKGTHQHTRTSEGDNQSEGGATGHVTGEENGALEECLGSPDVLVKKGGATVPENSSNLPVPENGEGKEKPKENSPHSSAPSESKLFSPTPTSTGEREKDNQQTASVSVAKKSGDKENEADEKGNGRYVTFYDTHTGSIKQHPVSKGCESPGTFADAPNTAESGGLSGSGSGTDSAGDSQESSERNSDTDNLDKAARATAVKTEGQNGSARTERIVGGVKVGPSTARFRKTPARRYPTSSRGKAAFGAQRSLGNFGRAEYFGERMTSARGCMVGDDLSAKKAEMKQNAKDQMWPTSQGGAEMRKEGRLALKVELESEVRRFWVREDVNFTELVTVVSEMLGALKGRLEMGYIDDENDRVGLATEIELDEMKTIMKEKGISPVRLYCSLRR